MAEEDFTPLTEYIKRKYAPGLNFGETEFGTESFHRNQIVFSEGATAYDAYLVRKGRIEISVTVEGRKVVLTRLGEKTVFGEMALVLKEHKRTATAMAVEDSELVVIPKSVFDKYVNATPKLISTCLFTIASRLESTTRSASKRPSGFEYVSRMMHLFAVHGQYELLYEETLKTISTALARGETAVTEVLSLMENLNLIALRDAENGQRMIHVLEKERFFEKAMNVLNVLKQYQADD